MGASCADCVSGTSRSKFAFSSQSAQAKSFLEGERGCPVCDLEERICDETIIQYGIAEDKADCEVFFARMHELIAR